MPYKLPRHSSTWGRWKHARRREIRVTVAREKIPALADFLRDHFQARPELVLAEDTRARGGDFTWRGLFELEGADAIVVVSAAVPADDKTFPSLATRWYLASRFEREIHDLFGLVPTEHPDLRRLPLHQFWPSDYHPLLQDAAPPGKFVDDGTPYPFRRVQGEGIYEITVGPVHAGIIEPGHFRFSVEGETIVNLESRMYFVHKGIEKLFETKTLPDAVQTCRAHFGRFERCACDGVLPGNRVARGSDASSACRLCARRAA